MIEFTISRVVLAVCGVALLAAATGTIANLGSDMESSRDADTAMRIASVLDRFESSAMTELVIEGWELLPTEEHVLSVGGHLVTVTSASGTQTAYTASDAEFELTRHSSVTISKSLPEGLGDGADRVGE